MWASDEELRQYEALHGSQVRYSEADFRPYQHWMVDRAYRMPAVFLAADMGLGKTACSLFAAWLWKHALMLNRVLIIAPKPVAENTWPEEIAQWSFSSNLTFTRITGTVAQRQAALRRDGYLHIINRENVPWLLEHVPEDYYDALIYDEASRFKSGRLRTRAKRRPTELAYLVKRRAYFHRVVLLSGTPTPNGVIDLWGPMKLVDNGKRLGVTRQAFLERWFKFSPYSRVWRPREGADEDIRQRISDVFFSLTTDDHLDMRDAVEVDSWVVLPPDARSRYDRLRKQAYLDVGGGAAVDAQTAGVLANKLLQFANGHAYDDLQRPVRFHTAKLDRLEALLARLGEQPVLVFYSYKFDLEALRERFPQAEVFGEDEDQVRRWNAGDIPLLLLHPQSAGHGLNLQRGGSVCIWFGLPWSLEVYQQANKRLHRPGQKNTVRIFRILARDTYDEKVASVLTMKAKRQDRLLMSLRAEIDPA